MKRIIKKILREQFEYKEQLFSLLRTGDEDNLEMVKMISQGHDIDVIELLIEFFKENNPPYLKMLNHFDLTEEEINYVLYGIFGEPVNIRGRRIFNQNGNKIYYESSKGSWDKYEYDDNGNQIYYESSNGYWSKSEYDENGKRIYYENSKGEWEKSEYDENGKLIYWENSDGKIYDRR